MAVPSIWNHDLKLVRAQVAFAVGFIATVTLALTGCGLTINNPALLNGPPTSPGSPASPNSPGPIHGHVGGEQWSVSGSSVQLYAVGTQGTGSTAIPLLAKPVETDSHGDFTITENYACPLPASQLYVVATGGNPGLASGTNNHALSLMSMLGSCSALSSKTIYPVNEVTTVGSVWPLSPYMASPTQLGSSSSDTTFSTSMTRISQLINLANAVSPGTGIPAGYAVQTAKLYTLADDLHACVASSGGTAGDGSACGQLFSLVSPQVDASPTDTIDAALRLAQANQLSVDGLFQFLPAEAPFQPVLSGAPTDWDLDLVQIPGVPTFTPAAGTYAPGQQITLRSGTPGAVVHYTLDGSAPGQNSAVYSAPMSLSSAETVRAIAIIEDIVSAVSSATFAVNAVVNVSLTPLQVTLSPSQSQQFTATVTGSSNSSVAWTFSPAIGTISATGLYTAPASIGNTQGVKVSATSRANPSKGASATVTLNQLSVVAVSVAPGSATLAPSQSQQFTAGVTGTSDTNVTWALNPAVGTISATGLYTAPASIVGLQNIIVTATSNADPTKAASANVSITPAGAAHLTYYVDNVKGSDSNNGTSIAAPFATVAKVNALTPTPGQTVAFKSGDVWHEMLTISRSGAPGAPITYSSYGTGAQPVIDASDTVTGWTQGSGSSSAGSPSYVWSRPQATNPLLINFGGQAGSPVASSADISAAKQFAWNGSTLSVYSTTNPTSIVEIAARTSALTSPGASYINVSNLELRGGTDIAYCGVAHPCTNWDFESNTFDSGYGVGLRWLLNNGVSGGGLIVNNNTFRGTGNSGIGLSNGGSAMGDLITNNTMTDLCKIYIAGSAEHVFCDAINLFSQTETDGGGQILNNKISQVGLTSGAGYGGGIHPDTVVNWDIEHNTISDTNYPGISLEKGSGSIARYNLLVNAGQRQYFGGLFIRAGDGLSVSNMLAEYNTVVGGYWACALLIYQNAGAVTATNVSIARNICTGSSSGTQFWLDPGYAAAGNSFMSNGFGVATANFISAGNVTYGSYQLLPSPVTDSIAGDPQFVSPATGNYELQPTSPDLTIGAFPQP
jgi:Chitobiase/beta-hexosaminidase C-terminal domain/Bacterial Ig-like domain (group 2)